MMMLMVFFLLQVYNQQLELEVQRFETPGEAYGVFGRTQSGAPVCKSPTTTFNHVAGYSWKCWSYWNLF
jgi:hypothetical protein